jgi:hypothetical protein
LYNVTFCSVKCFSNKMEKHFHEIKGKKTLQKEYSQKSYVCVKIILFSFFFKRKKSSQNIKTSQESSLFYGDLFFKMLKI